MKLTKQTLGFVAGMAATLLASTAHAQIITYDFDVSDGGWTSQVLSGVQDWSWSAGNAGWRVDQSASAGQARLLSPFLRATGTSAAVTMRHRYNFEANGSAACFDGGNWKLSVNSSAFFVGAFDVGGYTGPIENSFGNPMAGQTAFCGQSAGWANPDFVTSQESGSVGTGDIYQFAFDASWDTSVSTAAPNWEITGIELRGFEVVSVVPEPSTYAMLLAGMAMLGVAARKRRRI